MPRRIAPAFLVATALVATALVATAPAASAQSTSSADGDLCFHAQSAARYPEDAARAQALARQGGGAGAFAQGCLLMGEANYDKATDAFERAVAADGNRAAYHYFLGQAYGARAQRANVFSRVSLAKKTKAEFERAVALDPDYLDAREGLLTYYLVAPGVVGGSKDRARAEAEEIRRRNAYRGGLVHAQIAGREKDEAGMVRELDALTRQFPDSTGPHTALALYYGQQKRWGDAWGAADRLLRALPNAPVAQYVVGRLAAESGEQLERGTAALGRYLETTPRPGDPSHATARWRLGTIYERQGRKDAARAQYEAAVRLDPKLAGARDALKKLG